MPLLRWPGGCYADHYHWRDGIGSPEERPRRLGMSCGLQVEDNNGLGTHEFCTSARCSGLNRLLAGNVGSGTPQELCDWVEYCNMRSTRHSPATARRMVPRRPSMSGFGASATRIGDAAATTMRRRTLANTAGTQRCFVTSIRAPNSSSAAMTTPGIKKLLITLGSQMKLVDHLSIHSYSIDGGPGNRFRRRRLLPASRGSTSDRSLRRPHRDADQRPERRTADRHRPRRVGCLAPGGAIRGDRATSIVARRSPTSRPTRCETPSPPHRPGRVPPAIHVLLPWRTWRRSSTSSRRRL